MAVRHQDHRQRKIGRRQIGKAPAGDDAEQGRHAREQEKAERVQADADVDGAIVTRAENFLQESGETTNAGASTADTSVPRHQAAERPVHGVGRTHGGDALQPPVLASASGSATAKPASFTLSWTTFTHADVNRPPAAKYTGDHHSADARSPPVLAGR